MSPTQIYTLSLHDALPISGSEATYQAIRLARAVTQKDHIIVTQGGYNGWHDDVSCNLMTPLDVIGPRISPRSEEHTSELQSLRHLVCRLLLEKKKKKKTPQ